MPASPRDQYVAAVRSGRRLFVAGHDPERQGRLVYVRGADRPASARDARAAFALATRNALAAARDAAGPLGRWRCILLTAFGAGAASGGLDPRLLADSLELLRAVLPAGSPPVAQLRPAQSLAGGMLVEVELVLEAPSRRRRTPSRVRPSRPRRRRGGPGGGRAPRRSGGRTS